MLVRFAGATRWGEKLMTKMVRALQEPSTRSKRVLAWVIAVALVGVAGAKTRLVGDLTVARAASTDGKYPVFEADTSWGQLPNGWSFGLVSKIAVDKHDNVWVIHRPKSVPTGKTAAPPVVEFDANGKFVQGWGGEGAGYDWPDNEHNVYVDAKDNVWISGTGSGGTAEA